MTNPEYQFDGIERAHLAAMINTDGFKVLQKIFEIECEKFRVLLDNADSANDREVLAAHNLRKAAVMFYAGVINRLNAEIELYKHSPKASDLPEDVTEGKLDIGENGPFTFELGGEE